MSKSEVLYVKGMIMSESEEEDVNESAWDDRKLTDAYDKALKIANAEVAKRVAMSTNTHETAKVENTKSKKGKSSSQGTSSKKKLHQWRAGMPCRSVYEGDGLEYEAFILRIINNEECIVRYLGYENSEIVPIKSLKQTHGNDERTKQIEIALQEKADDCMSTQSPNQEEDMEASDRMLSPDSVGQTTLHKKKRSCKKKKSNTNSFQLPEMPPLPNISMMRNAGSIEMPMPPPPIAFPSSNRSESEEQAISSMLLSWYMSGYYTGLYQGLKRSKENHNNV